jgi:site-specific recombinase XerD
MDFEKLNEYLSVKSIEGCSPRTIKLYKLYITKLLEAYDDKKAIEMTTNNVRCFLADYKEQRHISNATLDNMRRCYHGFFTWLQSEGYTQQNITAPIKRIKTSKIIKDPFSEEELEILRENAEDTRTRALIELLYSSGMRIGELEQLNKSDINWSDNSIRVFGKGAKERTVWFNVRTGMLLDKYLKERTDNNPALFVSKRSPYKRLGVGGFEKILKRLGDKVNIHCHPHRFRRTCATNLMNKGVPVQEVSEVLGHAKLETTMIYCQVDQNQIKMHHKQFMN